MISSHKDVQAPRWKKGIHYFDINFSRDTEWYRSHFPKEKKTLETITGEASPYYLFHPAVPQRIYETIPDVKLIVLLRNPIDRAISHYKHEVRRGFESLNLQEALAAEHDRMLGESLRINEDPSYVSFSHQHHSYVSRGQYAEQIARYLQLFPRQELMVIESEQFWSQPSTIAGAVFRFLGLADDPALSLPHMNATIPTRIPDATREYLAGRFQEANSNLGLLLGMDFSWL
jgi:hypothetical protein